MTTGARDLSGRGLSSQSISEFTVERDYWEGTNGNDYPADARNITSLNPYGNDAMFRWFDFVPTIQEEEWTKPIGAHSNLAQLESTDYYILNVPDDVYELELRIFFTSDETNGATLDPAGDDALRMSVNHGGYGISPSENIRNEIHNVYTIEGPGTYSILIQENTFDYSNRRTYNLQYYYGDGY